MKNFFLLIILSTLLSILLISCAEDTGPSIFNPDRVYKDDPEITALTPTGSTLAGVGEIIITGRNFSPIEPYNEYNQVLFGSVLADILEMSEIEITVQSPVIVGDSIPVKIYSRGAVNYSTFFFYNINAAVAQFGKFPDTDLSSAIASDLQGNVYVSVKGEFISNIKKITPNGVTTDYAQTTFLSANGMKVGPDNVLYAAVAAGRRKLILKIDSLGVESTFATLQILPKDLDFDQDKNLWVIGRQSTTTLVPCDILRIKPDGTQETMKTYQAYLQTVRVYNDNGNTYVYVAGYNETTSEQKIWRSQIQPDGTLGTDEVVLDIAAASWLGGITVKSITFSQDGKIYMGTTGDPDAMFIYDPQSSSNEILYTRLIGPSIYDLIWGEGEFLFAVQQPTETSSYILKIDTRTLGAIYYGRQP